MLRIGALRALGAAWLILCLVRTLTLRARDAAWNVMLAPSRAQGARGRIKLFMLPAAPRARSAQTRSVVLRERRPTSFPAGGNGLLRFIIQEISKLVFGTF